MLEVLKSLRRFFLKLPFCSFLICQKYNLHDQKSDRWTNRSREAIDLFALLYRNVDVPIRVADLGCGDMKIRDLLLSCGYKKLLYQGFDCLPQSDDVKKIDFNKEEISGRYDVVFCMGVLEYLDDIPRFLLSLRGKTSYVIMSYVASDTNRYSKQDIRFRGWKNHFTSSKLEGIFFETGFFLNQKKVLDQGVTMLYLLKD